MGTTFLRTALLAACLVSATFSFNLNTEEQANVTVALDRAQHDLDTFDKVIETEQEAIETAIKVTETVQLLKTELKLVSVVSKIGNVLKGLQAVGAVASFILSFFMPSQLDVIAEIINQRFNEVNAKLDSLDRKLDRMEESIKSNTAFNVFLSKWIDYEYKAKNGAKKLSEIRRAMGKTNKRISQVKLAEEFINYYEYNNLDGNLMNTYRMAALSDSITNRNIFDRFVEEFHCDVKQLSYLMIVIKRVMTILAQQTITYYYFKGDYVRARESFKEIQEFFYDIRRAYDTRVWNCYSNALERAEKDANIIVDGNKMASQEIAVKSIFDKLSREYSMYTWAVAAAKDDRKSFPGLQWRGSTYFEVHDTTDPEKAKVYYITYQDPKAVISCIDIEAAQSLMVFERCKDCSPDFMRSARNFLTSESCGTSVLERVFHPKWPLEPFGILRFCGWQRVAGTLTFGFGKWHSFKEKLKSCYLSRLSFIASTLNTEHKACGPMKCNGHGQCKAIPHTSTHLCICDKFYEGRACEKRTNIDDTIEKMMSRLRQKYNVVNGVPTAVDIFFLTRDVSKKLDDVLKNVKASFDHTNQIIQHSKIIYNAEDIADLYAKLQTGEFTFDRFGEKVDRYLKTITTPFELEHRLKKLILGEGLLDTPGRDIFNTYKREYISYNGGGCSEQYNKDIQGFRDSLAQLDHAVGEALLWHLKWSIQTKGTTDKLREKYIKEAEYLTGVFMGRQEEYKRYWNHHSCGPIQVSGAGLDCKGELTYEGMSIPISCDKEREPEPTALTCVCENDTLIWDSQPKCKFVWESFGNWSSCSKSCGGGTKTRYRNCTGSNVVEDCVRDQGGVSSEISSCNTDKCCTPQNGKFECSNKKCISKDQLCDGVDDCENFEDESRSRCFGFIRSGNRVAFENQAYRGTWMSCYGAGQYYNTCQLRTCPGASMSGNDWSHCGGEIFVFSRFRNNN